MEAGEVCWVDQREILFRFWKRKKYPDWFQGFIPGVLHRQQPIQKNSYAAVIANESLYSYGPDGMIQKVQGPGYTAILERNGNTPNYEKFLLPSGWPIRICGTIMPRPIPLRVPIGNLVNRRQETLENAKVSDMVRQFAIDWYLDDEVRKLTREKEKPRKSKEKKLPHILTSCWIWRCGRPFQKAQNYLKPFSPTIWMRIYAVAWEPDAAGGKDQDSATLCCDENFGDESEGYYFGISAYLPYGVYVAAEQMLQI